MAAWDLFRFFFKKNLTVQFSKLFPPFMTFRISAKQIFSLNICVGLFPPPLPHLIYLFYKLLRDPLMSAIRFKRWKAIHLSVSWEMPQ